MFRAPFFRKVEQINYQLFPLGMVKTIVYIQLIAIPDWAKKRRFKELRSDVAIGYLLGVVSKLKFWLSVVITIYGILYFMKGGIIIYIYG